MARVAPVVPEESALLCEGCGYILTGIPIESNCPECGKKIAESLPATRRATTWEQPDISAFRRFWSATFELIVHPSRFYRNMATRSGAPLSYNFGSIHRFIASCLFGLCAFIQAVWLWRGHNVIDEARYAFGTMRSWIEIGLILLIVIMISFVLSYFFLYIITRIAARLTTWEAAYRGLRLPHHAVLRGLDYHSAHYLPVALVAFTTVGGYQILLATHVLNVLSATKYLYLLCAEVILSAAYLFSTHWKGMRNMMFANA